MKKKQLKEIGRLAASLPKAREPRTIYRPMAKLDDKGAVELDVLGRMTIEIKPVVLLFPVNHRRRLKRSFLRDGEQGINRYMRKVMTASRSILAKA